MNVDNSSKSQLRDSSKRQIKKDKYCSYSSSKSATQSHIQHSNRLQEILKTKICGQSQSSNASINGVLKSSTSLLKHNSANVFSCQICIKQCESTPGLHIASCQHQQSYCSACLHKYAIILINSHQEVTCPNFSCQHLLDTEGRLFKELPVDTQLKYKKLHAFYSVISDSSSKMCPTQRCDGIIKFQRQDEKVMICDECKGRFCAICLAGEHEGECEEYEVLFYENQLSYKRCQKCKAVIQKSEGCNHMTCLCGFQFCYACGAGWDSSHYSKHHQIEDIFSSEEQARLYENNSCCRTCPVWAESVFVKFPLFLMLSLIIAIFVLVTLLSGLVSFPCLLFGKSYRKCFDASLKSAGRCLQQSINNLLSS